MDYIVSVYGFQAVLCLNMAMRFAVNIFSTIHLPTFGVGAKSLKGFNSVGSGSTGVKVRGFSGFTLKIEPLSTTSTHSPLSTTNSHVLPVRVLIHGIAFPLVLIS